MRRELLLACAVVLLVPLALLAIFAEISLRGSFTGIYVLRGQRKPLEIRSDIFLDEERRVLFALPFGDPARRFEGAGDAAGRTAPYLEHRWEPSSGDGFVLSHLGGGRLLVANWSRFLDDTGEAPSGLFLGGALPFDLNAEGRNAVNDTGMAYFDGRRWYHGWCSINELLALGDDPNRKIPPRSWTYLGSSVLEASPSRVLITSRHQAQIDGVPLRIQKWVLIKAGELSFTMATRLENVGRAPVRFYYLYGDEPWVGDYGRSAGNVGWTRQGLVHYEGFVDPAATDFVGFFDVGNSVIGERGPFTGTANFLQWLGSYPPTRVFFTNMQGPLRPPWNRVPLAAARSRALFLQWGPVTMPPRGVRTYLVAMGMVPPAAGAAEAALPRPPQVVADPHLLSQILVPDWDSRPTVPRAIPDDTQILPGP